jgi:hypothetical protein
MKIVRESINEIKRSGVGFGSIGVGSDEVFPHIMRELIKKYNLYYVEQFNPENVFENELHYQFFKKIVESMKCRIVDIKLIDLEGMDENEKENIFQELKLSSNDIIKEYNDVVATINTFRVQVCKYFAILESTSKTSFARGDVIVVNNTKYKFFQ